MAYDAFGKIAKANGLKNSFGGLIKEGTESVYNMDSNIKEQGAFDTQADSFLRKMYEDDLNSGVVKNLDYRQYLSNLTGALFNERVNLPREDDPTYYRETGDLFFNVYEGDFDAFKASALSAKTKDVEYK